MEASALESNLISTVVPAHGTGDSAADDGQPACASCAAKNAEPLSYVYALGRLEARFPSLSVEKEFLQVVGRSATAGKTDQQILHAALSQRENRYLARQMCWVLTIRGLETYLLRPRDPADFERLVEAVRPVPNPADLDVVIGIKGPIAPPELCNGLMLPIVLFQQIYSFDRSALIESIPQPPGVNADGFRPIADEVLERIMQITDNAGSTDEHRALNYLAMRYSAIYAKAAEELSRDFALTGIEARPSLLNGGRKVYDAILTFRNRSSDFTEKFFARVDVTDEFPFLVTKLSTYLERT